MTEILVLLYLGDVAYMLGFVAIFGVVISAVVWVVCAVSYSENDMSVKDENIVKADEARRNLMFQKRALIGITISCLIFVLVPRERTINVAIAARAGQLALNTNLGQKSLQAIEAVLDKVISNAKKASE